MKQGSAFVLPAVAGNHDDELVHRPLISSMLTKRGCMGRKGAHGICLADSKQLLSVHSQLGDQGEAVCEVSFWCRAVPPGALRGEITRPYAATV